MTAFPHLRGTTPANAVSQGMKNKVARDCTPVKATTSLKSSTPVEVYIAAKANSPVKASTPVNFGKPAKNMEVVRAGRKGKALINANGTTLLKV